ncbi:MAG: C-terminal target protein, partial [Frankiales bacterium]|nr:C-terminal target protein [Frankiales bacterium]
MVLRSAGRAPSARGRTFVVLVAVSALGAAGLTVQAGAPALAADASPVSSATIDFTTPTGTVASGYTADRGLGYDAARGFGWVTPGTSTPVDMSVNTRARTAPADQRLKTLVIMQGSGVSNQPSTGAFELSVVNGTYDVTVAVGDASYFDSVHRVTAEGTRIVNDFVPSSTTPFQTVTATVTVADGKLTLDPTGGKNTKIAYVAVAPATTSSDTTAPTVSWTPSGTTNGNGQYVGSVTVTLNASDASGIASRSYTVNGGAAQPYTAPVSFTTPGTYTVTGTATDPAGNSATTAPLTLTVVAAPTGNGTVSVSNADLVPYSDRLVLSRIEHPETGTTPTADGTGFIPANVVHDTGTINVTNTGTGPLTVSGVSTTGSFTATTATALPTTLAV